MLSGDLDLETAERFADLALANVVREYPNKPDHVLGGDADLQPPRAAAPGVLRQLRLALGVHMHWLLVHLRRRFPRRLRAAGRSTRCSTGTLRAEAIAAECAYLDRPGTQSFERTYGWAWLLKLADELARVR